MKNTPLILGSILALFLLLKGGGKAIRAKGSITLPDYIRESTGNVFGMPSGSSYKSGEIIGTLVPDKTAEAFGELLIRSSKNKNIYHTISEQMAKQFTTWQPTT